jgi:hypothetical protein
MDAPVVVVTGIYLSNDGASFERENTVVSPLNCPARMGRMGDDWGFEIMHHLGHELAQLFSH